MGTAHFSHFWGMGGKFPIVARPPGSRVQIDGAEAGFMRSHPSHRTKDVARMGHLNVLLTLKSKTLSI